MLKSILKVNHQYRWCKMRKTNSFIFMIKIDPKLKKAILLMRENKIPLYKLYISPLEIPFILLGASYTPALYWSFRKLLIVTTLLSITLDSIINIEIERFVILQFSIRSLLCFLVSYLVCKVIYINDILPVRKILGKDSWDNF